MDSKYTKFGYLYVKLCFQVWSEIFLQNMEKIQELITN